LKRHELLPAALTFSIFIALFWAEMFFTGRLPFFRDSALQFYPWQEFASASIRSGDLPLWNPYSFCGAPFLANLQSAVFYPLKMFFYVMPYAAAFKTFFFANMLLGALFTFALARSFKLSAWASLLSGLVFVLNGHLTNRLEFMSVFAASVWLPLAALSFKKFNEEGKLGWFLALVFALAMQIFAGSAQIFLYTFVFLALYLVYFILTGKKWVKRSLSLAAAAALALLLSAAQLFPFIEYVFNSLRSSGLGLQEASRLSLPLSNLLNFVFPDFSGNPAVSAYRQGGGLQYWATALYCGLLPFVFAVFLGVNRKKPETIFYLSAFAFFVLYALGSSTPLYANLYNALPVFRFIRYPATALLCAVFPLSVLAGFGLDALLKGAPAAKKGALAKLPYWLLAASALALVLVFVAGRPEGYGLFRLETQASFAALAICTCFLLLFLLYRNKILTRDAFALLLLLLIFSDFVFYGNRNNPLCREAELTNSSKAVDIMKTGKKEYFRYVIEPNTHKYIQRKYFEEDGNLEPIDYGSFLWEAKNLLFQNLNVREHLCNANGYDPMRPSVSAPALSKMMVSGNNRLADLCNVKYIISYMVFSDKVLKPAGKAGLANIYENTRVLPRVFIPTSLELNGPDITERAVFDPQKKLLLSTQEAVDVPEEMTGTAEILEYGNRKVKILVKSDTGGFVVLTDTWFPGWRALIDDKEQKIYRAYGFLRAVYVKPGLHEITYRYEPLSFTLGCACTLLALLFCCIFGGLFWKKRILA